MQAIQGSFEMGGVELARLRAERSFDPVHARVPRPLPVSRTTEAP